MVGLPLSVDRVVLSSAPSPAVSANGNSQAEQLSARHWSVDVDCPTGCWLVFGMGHNTAWSATGPSGDIGEPVIIDGGFNGWWIEPTTGVEQVDIVWGVQRPVTIGLIVSAAAIIACFAIVMLGRRREPIAPGALRADPDMTRDPVGPVGGRPVIGLVGAAVAGVTISPVWGVIVALVVGLHCLVGRYWRPIPILAIAGLTGTIWVALSTILIERRDAPFPGAGWTTSFADLHRPALAAVTLVLIAVFMDATPNAGSDPETP